MAASCGAEKRAPAPSVIGVAEMEASEAALMVELESELMVVLEMAVTSALIPPLSVFWRLYGAGRFRVWFC